MRILQLIQKKQMRGAELFACVLSNHLQARGHDISVLALADGKDVLPFAGSIEVLHADLQHRFRDVKGWKALADFIKLRNPDLIQANAGDTLKYAVLSKLFFRWKQPIVFRNASMMSRYVKSPVTKWLNRFFLRNTAHIAAVSAFTKKDLEAHFGIAGSRITVLPVGVEHVYPLQLKERTERFEILHIGGFSFEKNHEGLLQIFERVLKQLPHARLTLVGDGILRSKIEKIVKDKGLSDSVRFTGTVTHVEAYLQQAAILVLPSIIEGLPSVLLEAFSCSVPVVAYNTGGISEVVHDETGWLVPLHDEAAFAETIISVATLSAGERAAKTAAAHATVQQHYQNNVIADGFEQLYKTVLNQTEG